MREISDEKAKALAGGLFATVMSVFFVALLYVGTLSWRGLSQSAFTSNDELDAVGKTRFTVIVLVLLLFNVVAWVPVFRRSASGEKL